MARFSLVSVLALGCTFPGDPVVFDLDGDGYLLGADCDDRNPQVFPTATEQCNGIDDDCDFSVDEGTTFVVYRDDDLDGFGNPKNFREVCELTRGWSEVAEDCDDSNSAVHPEAPEVCDTVDNNCDTFIDENLPDISSYVDSDQDGYGDDTTALTACGIPSGRVTVAGDCDDLDAGVNPAATEVCDSIDQNCDLQIDEGLVSPQFVDGDGDGWGNSEVRVAACIGASGVTQRGGDCDDGDADVLPGGTEVCDGTDDNCNGLVDENLTATYWVDADADTFGSTEITITACSAPPGFVTNSSDCDDLDANNFPGNTEICDFVDNDCDVVADEGMVKIWYADLDADGLGDPWTKIDSCTPPATHIPVDGDCDDTNSAVPPGCPTTLYGGWAGLGGDERRSGHALGTVGDGLLSSLWNVNLNGAVDPVAIGNGTVFATVGEGSDVDTAVVALDLTTGDELWRAALPSVDWLSGPTLVGAKVCLTRADLSAGSVVCYDADDGTQEWSTGIASISTGWYMSPVVYEDRVYSGAGAAGTMYAHMLSTGVESFRIGLGSPSGWGAAAWSGNIYVWEGSPDVIHKLATSFASDTLITVVGLPYAPFNTGSGVGNAIVISETGIGYIAGTTGLAAYTLSTNTVKFSAQAGITLNGMPAVDGDDLYGVKTDGTLSAWNANTGAFIRSFGGTGLVGPPIVTDDAVIAASGTTTFVYDRATGALLDSIPNGGSLAVGRNHLVLADFSGNVRGYSW